jgi:hypothetical protein
MLAKVNRISDDNRNVMITKLDIDDFGSVVPVRDLELQLPANDDSVAQTLRNSPYAAVFTDSDNEEDDGTIVLAKGISAEELNREKEKTIEKLNESKDEP